MKRGARVFEVTKDPYSIETWVRADGGDKEVAAQSQRRRVTQDVQTECGGMDIKAQMLNDDTEENKFLREYYLRRPDLMHLIPDSEFLN